jgi:copper resistance protein B
MTRALLLGAPALFLLASPAAAQTMDHSMPGMKMPAQEKAQQKQKDHQAPKEKAAGPKGTAQTKSSDAAAIDTSDHPHDDGSTMPATPTQGDAQAGHEMPPMPGMDKNSTPSDQAPGGTDLPAGDAPAPPPPQDHAADRVYSPTAMAQAREEFRQEQGGQRFYQIMFNLAEVQVRDGKDAYRWDGEAWFGGDINRLTLKSEGEGVFREGIETAEVQALYSRAIGPSFNVQAGIRHDFQPSPTRTYATIGFEGLVPRMFEAEGALFLSNKGDLLGRLEGYYDQRITQRLILQPRAELNFSAQDVPENRIGSGVTDAELGLRLRYEIKREFAPYIGISYETKTGRTAEFARANGEGASGTSLVAGIRFWF